MLTSTRHRNVTVQKCAHFWRNRSVTKTVIAHNVTFILKSTNFRDDFQIIVKCLHNLIAAKMESSPDDAAVKDMLREWAGEDVEMVLDEMRKLRLIEKVVRGRQITDRMHEIPKSYGKFAGLNVSQKLKIHKMWSLMTDVESIKY